VRSVHTVTTNRADGSVPPSFSDIFEPLHDVAPARDGGVWFIAQSGGCLGHLDPGSGAVTRVRYASLDGNHVARVDTHVSSSCMALPVWSRC
jgi:streptogramin lyase